MNGGDILSLITVFVLSAFVGFEVIAKVPSTLAHSADVGHERHPRCRARRSDARPRHRERHDARRSSGSLRWSSPP